MIKIKRYLFPSLLGLAWLPTAQAATDCTAVTEIPQQECEALVALYNSTDGANWLLNDDWNVTNTPCSWWGITCSAGHVTEISLGYNNFNGTIPNQLGNLSQLTTLSLNGNQLTGSIPAELGNLSQLTTLDLSWNDLTGSIPAELGNLSQLTTLDLNYNQLTGAIPTELGNLTQLTTLDLSGNDLTGSIPAELGNLTQLTTLDLSGNDLTGSIPAELGNLSQLTTLDLSGNDLIGSIPVELGNLSQLTTLYLNGNQLTGSIPTELGNLSQLTTLDLSWNTQYDDNYQPISGLTGTIPSSLGNLSQLTSLSLSSNQLTGSIPTELGSLSQLTTLNLSENTQYDDNYQPISGFTGNIPTSLGNLSQLTTLNLGGNQLTGSIPTELSNLSQLTELDLSSNQLTGSISVELENLSQLTNLDFSGNQLTVTGSICPMVTEIPQVECEALVALYNSTDGANWSSDWNVTNTPCSWSGVSCSAGQVTDIYLGYNNLNGTIPRELGNLTQLTTLNLSPNQLTGSIPTELGNLTQLTELDLGGNQLTGSIPTEIGNLTQLTELDLGGNQLTGSIPAELGNLAQLTELDLGENQLISIPTELGNLSQLTSLDLSSNQLTGSIPTELGNLSQLTSLDLSSNQLTGSIPPELENLEQLSIGGNQLTGAICTLVTEIPQVECEALVALYNSTDGANWSDSPDNGWNGTNTPCNWWGITCNAGQVTEIYLGYHNLNGTIPRELGNLSQLTTLNLSPNQLTGSIPTELGNLTQLTELDLGGNQLTGSIPTEIGNLTQLTELDLGGNQLTGTIPTELGNLSQLTTLDLSGIEQYDDNGESILSGLTGSIPTSLGNLSQLTTFDLSGNQLTGTIPTELGNLSQLTDLNLSGNQLDSICPIVTEIPQVQCEALVALYNSTDGANWYDSSYNDWNVTNTPCSWWGITCNAGQVTEISLGYHNLNGTIPSELGNLSQLTTLDLSWNDLTGSIPAELGNLSQLTTLDLNWNDLTGSIPAELGNLSQLTTLNLSSNQLTGSISVELENLSQLTNLDFSGNQLTVTGSICPMVTEIPQVECEALVALYNSTDGANWWWYSNWNVTNTPCNWSGVSCNTGQVTDISLGYNNLNGTIPSELGNLSQLVWLDLSWNELTGPIPSELGNLSQLGILFLADNQLSNEIPTSLSNLTNLDDMWGLDLGYNNLTASDPDLIDFLNLYDSDWAETQFLTLATCATGSVTMTPKMLDFGSEAVDNSLALTANVRSEGCDDLQIDTIDFAGNDAADFSVQNQECYDGEWQGETFTACQFNIAFSPTVAGDKEASFNMVFNNTEVPDATMPLQATAVNPQAPEISVSPSPIDFGNVTIGESTTPQTVTVENTGDINLQIDAITLTGADATEFSFYGDCSSKTFMRPGEQCQLSAQLIPETEGDKQAALDISAISTVALTGQAMPLLDCADGNIRIQTIADGSWDSANTWDLERIPNENDVVRINSGHTITGSASYLNVKTLCIETDATLESLDDQGTGLQIAATDYMGNKGTIRGRDGALGQPGASIYLSSGSGWWEGNPFYNEGRIIAGHGGDSQQQGGHGGMIHISGGGLINTPNENGNGGIIQAGNGGDITGTQAGQAGEGGRIAMWGSEFLRHQGDIRITAGNGGNCNPSASGFQTGGEGGYIITNANLSIHLQGTFQAGNGSTNCNVNGIAGQVYIDPAVISISGENTSISGGEVTINGADTIELTDLSDGAIRATGDITLAANEDHVIDMRGNTGQFLQAGKQVQILADEIVLDEEVKLSEVVQANNTMVGPSRVLREVSLTSAGLLSGEPGETIFINFTLSNNGPETDTYTLNLSDSQGWSLTPLPDNTIEIEGLGGLSFEQEVTLPNQPGERNLITITATSQADPEVKATAEVQVTVAGGSRERPSSSSNSSGSGTKPLRPTMNIFVEIQGRGQGNVEIISDKGSMTCEPRHCQAVDYAQDFTGMACDPNYCTSVVDTGTTVTLTPKPDKGSIFKSWGGHPDCSKTNRPVTGNRLCIAYFGKED
jgi:Leucine-rich repeat (LRR) protein